MPECFSIIITYPKTISLFHKITETLQKLKIWFNKSNLFLNQDKTNIIWFNFYQKKTGQLEIYSNGIEIRSVESSKLLEILLDECLTWGTHWHNLIIYPYTVIFKMKLLKSVLHQLLSFYNAEFHSWICYGICFWGTYSVS